MSRKFPEIQGGGSLVIAWQAKESNILVIGGGQIAAGRILHALNADAKVTVVCPRSGLNDEVAFRIAQEQVEHIDRNFEASDLDNADMVLCAVDDPAASSTIWKLCKERRIPANIADVPSECDFYFGSVYRDGPLQVMVSTNGNGPKMASIVRKQITEVLPKHTGTSIINVGKLRRMLRDLAPGVIEGQKRMKWASDLCESWSLEELAEMNEKDMKILLESYETGKVPTFEVVRRQLL